MFHVDFLIMHNNETVDARIRNTNTKQREIVPKAEYNRYAAVKFSNAKYVNSMRSGAYLSGLRMKLRTVPASELKVDAVVKLGLSPTVSKYYKPPQNVSPPKVKKMLSTDALYADTPIPVFEMLADMVVSLQKSEYKKAFLLKGGFVLMAAVLEKGKHQFVRGTTDLDLDFHSEEKWEAFVSDVCDILTSGSSRGLNYKMEHRRGYNEIHQSDRLNIGVYKGNTQLTVLGIDMNVKKLFTGKEYKIPELSFTGARPHSMLVDKLAIASSKELLRRTKDMIDMYVISKVFSLRMSDIINMVEKKKRFIEFPPFLLDGDNIEKLSHAYDKQEVGASMRLSFEEVYRGALDFTTLIYQEIINETSNSTAVWNCESGVWR